MPIDAAFMAALPPDVRKVVDQFHPSGSVKAAVRVFRRPLVGPRAKPEGHLVIDADARPQPPVRDHLGRPALPDPQPDRPARAPPRPLGSSRTCAGGTARTMITGNGRVQKLDGPDLPNGEPPLKIDLKIQAENLPFNDELRKALQPAWQKTWAIINPTGASDVDGDDPHRAGRPDVTHITIVPRARVGASGWWSRRPPSPASGLGQAGTIELRMENVRGRFDFDNGKVAMRDVNFFFHGAPVQFASGEVVVEDSGRFALAVSDLWVKDIRFDSSLRNIMPPLDGAVRPAAGRRPAVHGDGATSRSAGRACPASRPGAAGTRTRAVFIDNTIKAGIPLEHIQGQLEEVRGWSDGRALEVHGIMQAGQRQPAGPADHRARVAVPRRARRRRGWTTCAGRLLGGELLGNGSISLDDTPKYSTSLRLQGRRAPGVRQDPAGPAVLPRHAERRDRALSGLGSDVAERPGQGRGAHHPGGPRRAAGGAPVRQVPEHQPVASWTRRGPRASRRSTRPTSSSGSSTARRSSTRSSSPASAFSLQGTRQARPPGEPRPAAQSRSTAATGSTCRSSAT